ncbi:hypothetical protein HPB48_001632 [Haemaphysalis longicornis]|uniref:Uncharacterized protein n=1 Tax=Haemaphysalis longicornis TaxID=44386 RepID=A0A9J6FZP6_HAELO|nr:hypothetical protein HPB48_001632 [Haemaphysalis longicornis]
MVESESGSSGREQDRRSTPNADNFIYLAIRAPRWGGCGRKLEKASPAEKRRFLVGAAGFAEAGSRERSTPAPNGSQNDFSFFPLFPSFGRGATRSAHGPAVVTQQGLAALLEDARRHPE